MSETGEKRRPGRPRKEKSEAKSAAAKAKFSIPKSTFAETVTRICGIMPDEGEAFQTHVKIMSGWIVANNGVLSSGSRLGFQFECCPHARQFARMYNRAKEPEAYAVDGNNFLRAKSGKLTITIPSVSADTVFIPPPDMPIADFPEEFLKTLIEASAILREKGERLVESVVLVKPHSIIACDGITYLEFYTARDMPTVCLPKEFINHLAKMKTKPTKFGLGWNQDGQFNSFTVWFGDDDYVRTQLPDATYPPSVESIPPADMSGFRKVDSDFLAAMEACEEFATDSIVSVQNFRVMSDQSDAVGAVFNLSSMGDRFRINAARVVKVKDYVVEYRVDERKFYFHNGAAVRGVIGLINDGVEPEVSNDNAEHWHAPPAEPAQVIPMPQPAFPSPPELPAYVATDASYVEDGVTYDEFGNPY